MPYSLVSAATLGFDLVRLPAGAQVADVLLVALCADTAGLSRLAAAHRAHGLTAEERAALAVRTRQARELAAEVPRLRGVRTAAAGPHPGNQRLAVLAAQLEQGTIGDAAAVERLLRDDVLGPEHPVIGRVGGDVAEAAADVLADAVVGWWAAGVLPPLHRRELTEPAERAGLTAPGPADLEAQLDLGPGAPLLRELLTELRDLDESGRRRWRAAAEAGRPDRRSWATAMHGAAWAAHVSGRTRTVSAAQLLGVLAFRDGGLTARDGAHGVWNAVAGCLQAYAVADLLDDESSAVLTAPLERPVR